MDASNPQRQVLSGFHGYEFKSPDYIIFVASLVISLIIGMVASCKSNNEAKVEDFLLGGRNMHFITVGLSMLGSVMNGIFIIGGPAEIYYNGAIYSLIAISLLLVAPVAAFVFVPIFRNLGCLSAYEYLEKRFAAPVRVLAAIIFTLYMVIFLGVVLYAPALAFSQVTGLPMWFSVAITGLFCTKYTVVGGIRAVIWTDTYQVILAILGLLVFAILGGVRAGNHKEVLQKIHDGGRFNFGEWSPDPTVRLTVWTQIVGQFFTWLPLYGANQMIIQRYNTVATNKDARRAVFTSIIAAVFMIMLVTAVGLVMYAYYVDCDPWTTGRIQRQDQVVPLFLMEIASNTPVLPGLFTSAVFAAALSSMSSAINSMSAVCIDDFIKPILRHKNKPVKDGTAIILSKVLAFVFGLLSIGLSYVATYLGPTLIQIPITVWGMVGGPLLGVFLLGMVFPCANSWGAFFGLIGSLLFTLWMAIGNILYREPIDPLFLSESCPGNNSTNLTVTNVLLNLNTTTAAPQFRQHSSLQGFYNISNSWYGLYGTLACIILGLLISFITDGIQRAYSRNDKSKTNKTIDASLMFPIKDTLLICCHGGEKSREQQGNEYREDNIHVNDNTEVATL